MSGLTHLDELGAARMVDVGDKDITVRHANAEGYVVMHPDTLALIIGGGHKKGDVLQVARLAGIMAAKKTGDLIPLCHPLPLDGVSIDLIPEADHQRVRIVARVRTTGRTGVEMEALTAVSIAALTIYDMCKAVDKAMGVDGIRLTQKTGGKSGDYVAPPRHPDLGPLT
mgnify:CR=1 FL=1